MEGSVAEKTLTKEDAQRENLVEIFGLYLKKEVSGEPKRILSIGCKFAHEAKPILGVFPAASYKGIDIDGRSIKVARMENSDLANSIFQEGDATKKETFGKEPWDIILVRHPQVCGEIFPEDPDRDVAQDWRIIMENSMGALKKGGTFFVSTITDKERKVVLQYINSHEGKMKIKVNCLNEFYANRAFNDAFIIVAKKEG